MKITSSYGVRILGINKLLYATIHIYQDAVAYLTDCVNEMWDLIFPIKGSNFRMACVERKVHAAGSRIPDYPFDEKFPNMPCYMRRSAIHDAVGNVSSYRANYDRWQKGGCIGKAPRLGHRTSKAPVFYKGNTQSPPC